MLRIMGCCSVPGLPRWRREDHHRKRLKPRTHRRGSLGFRQLNVFGNRKASTLISTGNDREATLGELARLILALERSSPVRVAIDGRTASGPLRRFSGRRPY
jgi:hypothetical protein